MSHLMDVKTQINDQESLIKALERMGIDPKLVEIHEKPVFLEDYYKEGNKFANVVIRRKHFTHCYSDMGFLKGKDGMYKAIVDDLGINNDREWMNKLNTYYGVERSKKALRRKRVRFVEEKDEEGRIKIRARV